VLRQLLQHLGAQRAARRDVANSARAPRSIGSRCRPTTPSNRPSCSRSCPAPAPRCRRRPRRSRRRRSPPAGRYRSDCGAGAPRRARSRAGRGRARRRRAGRAVGRIEWDRRRDQVASLRERGPPHHGLGRGDGGTGRVEREPVIGGRAFELAVDVGAQQLVERCRRAGVRSVHGARGLDVRSRCWVPAAPASPPPMSSARAARRARCGSGPCRAGSRAPPRSRRSRGRAVAQGNGGALVRREAGERGRRRRCVQPRLRRRRRRRCAVPARSRPGPAPAAAAGFVERGVGGDAVAPGAEAGRRSNVSMWRAIAIMAFCAASRGVVGVREDAPADGVDHRRVPAEQACRVLAGPHARGRGELVRRLRRPSPAQP